MPVVALPQRSRYGCYRSFGLRRLARVQACAVALRMTSAGFSRWITFDPASEDVHRRPHRHAAVEEGNRLVVQANAAVGRGLADGFLVRGAVEHVPVAE